jgi:hypothetical protein
MELNNLKEAAVTSFKAVHYPDICLTEFGKPRKTSVRTGCPCRCLNRELSDKIQELAVEIIIVTELQICLLPSAFQIIDVLDTKNFFFAVLRCKTWSGMLVSNGHCVERI